MRKLAFLLFLLALGLTFISPRNISSTLLSDDPVEVVGSSTSDLQVAFNPPEPQFGKVTLIDERTYDAIHVAGSGSLQPGKPNVPTFGRWILVPIGTTPTLVEINPGSPAKIADDFLLNPVQHTRADVKKPVLEPFVLDDEIYSSDADYPGIFASLSETQVLRGQDMAVLWLYPYQYNPDDEKLYVYPNLQVTVAFEGEMHPYPHRLRSQTFEQLMRHLAINADEVLAAEYEEPESEKPDAQPPNGVGYDYIILTAAQFQSAANQLAAWRQKSGFKTLVEVVPTNYSADKLKQNLQSAYDGWKVVPKYLLILGDAEYIAPHYRTVHPYDQYLKIGGDPEIGGHTGTDLYYGLLESSDPNNPEKDLLPEIMIGRISVDTAAQAKERIEGIINYEKSPPSSADFYKKVSLAAKFQDGYTCQILYQGKWIDMEHPADTYEDARYTQTCEDIASFLESAPQNKIAKRMYFAKPSVTPLYWSNDADNWSWDFATSMVGGNIPSGLKRPLYPWDANDAHITNAINNGTFLIIHRDHGKRYFWSNPYFSTLNAIFLNNQNKLPVVWSINCETGWFDNETDLKFPGENNWTKASNGDSLSEIFERPVNAQTYAGDYGALGVVAATRITDAWLNDRMLTGMIDAIWPDFDLAYGPNNTSLYEMTSVLQAGKAYMLKIYNNDYVSMDSDSKAQLEGYHWFGDPATKIRTTKPPLMIALAEKTLYQLYKVKPYSGIIKLKDLTSPTMPEDMPLEGAQVTISRGDNPRDYWVDYTNSEGAFEFEEFQPTSAGIYNLVVTAQDTIPISETIEVLPGPAGGIVFDEDVYNCSEEAIVKFSDEQWAETGEDSLTVTSISGENEPVYMEEGIPAGSYRGSIQLELGDIVEGDGVLQVGNWDWITVWYFDESDGAGGSGWVIDTANVDCEAPQFEGLETATPRHDCTTKLEWEAAEDPNEPLMYSIYRDQSADGLSGEIIGTTYSRSFIDYDVACGQRSYMVRAQDLLGNQESNTHELEVFLPVVYLPMVHK